ncbi:hypothetical protein MTX20_13520 [Bradyrhizobium sp. ISRA435]|nr:hypothetical protein MTX20_13520 [Bradyrhizobium sp. ISRA435]
MLGYTVSRRATSVEPSISRRDTIHGEPVVNPDLGTENERALSQKIWSPPFSGDQSLG